MHVVVNAAESVDGKLSTRERDQVAISGPADFERVESVAHEVADRLDLGATSHVLMGGTVDRVLATVAEDNA